MAIANKPETIIAEYKEYAKPAIKTVDELGVSQEGYKLNSKRWRFVKEPRFVKVTEGYFDECTKDGVTDYVITGTMQYTYTLENFR